MTRKRLSSIWLLGVLLISGCLGYRLTAAEVVEGTQDVLRQADACSALLDIEVETDLLKDSITVQIWDQEPAWLKIQVLSASTPQLREMAFATDGEQSILYSPRAGEVLFGAADLVSMPSVIEQLVRVWKDWILAADPQDARLLAREREGGLVIYRIEIPLAASGYAQYAIDAGEWWVRQVDYYDELLGEGTIWLREVECADADAALPDVQSALAIPEGVPIREVVVEDNQPLTLEEAQRTASFPLYVPTYLPGDVQLAAAYHLDKNIALVYTGSVSFSLVQGRTILQVPKDQATPIAVDGVQAVVIRDRERDGIVLIWQEEGVQYSIAGSLAQDEAVRIAGSMQPAFKNSSAGDAAAESKEGQ